MSWFALSNKLTSSTLEEEVLVDAVVEEQDQQTNTKDQNSGGEKRLASGSFEDEEPPTKKKSSNEKKQSKQSLEEVVTDNKTVKTLINDLFHGPRPLDGHDVFSVLKELCNLSVDERSKLTEKEWKELVESILSEINWQGLDAVLSLARQENSSWVPNSWLPVIYQSASRLVRDPARAVHNHSGAQNSPRLHAAPSSDGFVTGAFREHPPAFFEIGKAGGLRLGGRGKCWGRLRGYAFCTWLNLKKLNEDDVVNDERGDDSEPARQLYHFGNLSTGARLECFLVDGKDGSFKIMFRSRSSGNSGWSTSEGLVEVAINRWHFIVISHARPYLLGKAKISVFIDGALQKNTLSVPFPPGKDMDDCMLGYGLDGFMGSPSLFEGGDVGTQEAAILADRSRIRVENPHVVGKIGDDEEVDNQDEDMTQGLGYGQEDAADHQVDTAEYVKEMATRAGVVPSAASLMSGGNNTGDDSNKQKTKKMIFAFDPRCLEGDDRCPELVIRGTRRGRRDALELSPTDDFDMDASQTLMDDELEDDAHLEGQCSVRWESSLRRDVVELAGGARALLLLICDSNSETIGDALMFLGDALHADAHLRTSFLGLEGFGLIGYEFRKRFYRENDEELTDDLKQSESVLVQVALHMMRASPPNSQAERDFFDAGLKELLLDSRVSKNRAQQSLRLISGLAAEKPRWIRESVGVDGILRFMHRLESFPEAQQELASDVLRLVWVAAGEEGNGTGPTPSELGACLCYVAEHPISPSSRALILEMVELVKNKNTVALRSLAQLGGISYLLRIGSYAERNVKNPQTGVILREPEPLPALLGSSVTPPETRSALIELIGLILSLRASACIPMDADNPNSNFLIDQEATENDVNLQLGGILGLLKSNDYVETHELVLKSLLDYLPKPQGFFVWGALAHEAGDVKGMARVADALRRNPALAKSWLNQRGWASCFTQSSLQTGPISVAAKSAIVATLSKAEDGRHLDILLKSSPNASVWSDAVKSLVEIHTEIPIPLLIRALQLARRKDMSFHSEQERVSFFMKCLAAGDYLRNPPNNHWQTSWSWVLFTLPGTTAVDLAAESVKLAMSIIGKEFSKPSPDNRKRVFHLLKTVGSGSFENPPGQLRAEACLGLVQTYNLSDDGSVEKTVQHCLEHSNTVQDAVKKIIDTLPTIPQPLDESTQVSESLVISDPQVWVAAKTVAAASIRLKQTLKSRIVEDVRDRLAHRVTEKVRDRRFLARWKKLIHDDEVEKKALGAESLAWSVDEAFCERGSRIRRRLLHLSSLEDAKVRAVVPRNVPSAAAVTEKQAIKKKEEDSDWVKIGEEISRKTVVRGHDDLNEASSQQQHHDENQKEEATTVAVVPPPVPTPKNIAEARAKKMTLEEWVNRPPMSIRGELEGRWVDIKNGEKIQLAARAFIVRPKGECAGRIVVTNFALYFDPDPPGAAGNYFKLDAEQEESLVPSNNLKDDDDNNIEIRQRWSLSGIQRVLLRRHRMLESGCEIFMRGDACKSVFLRFEDVSATKRRCRVVRDRIVKSILSLLNRAARDRSQHPRSNIKSLVEPATAAWRTGAMSNFDYLMELNLLAGRSIHDFCQYPVFPWILADYRSEEINLEDSRSFRDLSKPVGALEPNRLEQFVERYETFDDPSIPKFMYGSHYSTAAGVVLHFLVRLEPFRSLHVDLHDKRYDVPDRLFTSVPLAWEASSSSQDLGEVKELTPEFYYLPAVFENRGQLDLGTSQSGVNVGAVELPPWAHGSAHTFVRMMRAALESPHVSEHLHCWINLIFGFQQRGPQAVKANNVFYYLTYPGAVDLESIDDTNMRKAVELQIAHFGQCPEQLEAYEPWPQREYVPSKAGDFFIRPRLGVDQGFAVDQEVLTVQARVIMRKPITTIPPEDATSDDGGGGGVLGLREDGAVFQLIKALGEDRDSRTKRNTLVGVRQPCVWSPDGSLMIFAGRAAQGTVELVVLDTSRGDGSPSARATLFAHDENVSCLAYDDGLLVTGANDGAVRLWRVGKAGAFKRWTVWTEPRRFLRGHVIGQAVTCAAANRSMGVVATASKASGIIVHDITCGTVLWRQKNFSDVARMSWDRPTGTLFLLSSNSSMTVLSIDGSTLNFRGRVEGEENEESKIVCFERVAPGMLCVAHPTSVEILELPSLKVLQNWPLPGVCSITPPPEVIPSSEFVQSDHVVINLVTTSRTVFVLRRSANIGSQSAFRLLREAPTAVVGVVTGVVSGATRGVTLIGALDNVRKGVEVGKGVASEAWDAFSSATGMNKQ